MLLYSKELSILIEISCSLIQLTRCYRDINSLSLEAAERGSKRHVPGNLHISTLLPCPTYPVFDLLRALWPLLGYCQDR